MTVVDGVPSYYLLFVAKPEWLNGVYEMKRSKTVAQELSSIFAWTKEPYTATKQQLEQRLAHYEGMKAKELASKKPAQVFIDDCELMIAHLKEAIRCTFEPVKEPKVIHAA